MIFVLQEEVRSKLALLEVCHQNEIHRTISAFARLQKYAESRKEIDRRLDVHFQRRMYGFSRCLLHFLKFPLQFL
jgi:nucleoporin GLE1